MARRSVIKARTQATNQIRALLLDGDDNSAAGYAPGKAHLARASAQLVPAAGLRLAPGSLGQRG